MFVKLQKINFFQRLNYTEVAAKIKNRTEIYHLLNYICKIE